MSRSRAHTRRTPRANPRGILVVHKSGYGFVQTAEGEYFIPRSKMAGAFDGDLVELKPANNRRTQQGKRGKKGTSSRNGGGNSSGSLGKGSTSGSSSMGAGRPVAFVSRVLDRAHATIVGRYEVAEPFGVVVPSDPHIPYDIFTQRKANPHIPDGALVRVRILEYPTRHSAATGVIEEVLGMAEDESFGVELIIARHKLETKFSEGALSEAREAVLDEQGALSAGYADLRSRMVFTIDPVDAKDFDDALSLERVDGLKGFQGVVITSSRKAVWRLGVHIADVSYYVKWGSSLDLDARRRGTSVYLVDRVIPMLPHELSNELCSLKPNEVRRSMTVDIFLDDQANLAGYRLYPALIQSKARLNYNQVQELFEGVPAADALAQKPTLADELAWRLRELSVLAKKRAAARVKAGGIDFVSTEAKVQLDGEGKAVGVELRQKTDATTLVEEAMILANETVAQHLEQHSFPCIFRVHDKPSGEALAALIPAFQEFSWFAQVDTASLVAGIPYAIQQVLALAKGRTEEELVNSLCLRAMQRAVYRTENIGHYGLASKSYAHFTSPIRRYPDLVVHRMLRAQLTKRPEKFDQEVANMPWIAENSSTMERIAEKAAAESQKLKMIEYLQQFIGRSFSAVVSGVTTYGLFARLDNTAEGFLPLRALGDEYFALDPLRHCLTGQDSNKVFRLGQRIPVVITVAEPLTGTLDFALAGTPQKPRTYKKGSKGQQS